MFSIQIKSTDLKPYSVFSTEDLFEHDGLKNGLKVVLIRNHMQYESGKTDLKETFIESLTFYTKFRVADTIFCLN